MKKYIDQLRRYAAANPIQFDNDCECPALDALYWHYSETHDMSNDKTVKAYRALDEYFSGVPFKEQNKIFMLVGSLCAEHERIAFLAGLRLGAQLMVELTEEDDN